MGVTHRLHRRVFAQVVLHIREQYLVDDDQAHREPHGDTQPEHVADRCVVTPVIHLVPDEFVAGQDDDIPGIPATILSRTAKASAPGSSVTSPSSIREAERSEKDAAKVQVTGHDAAINAERRPQLVQTGNTDVAPVDLGDDR